MKTKVFFILSSFRGGGAEKVFRLLAENFDRGRYDVSIILLGTHDSFFSTDVEGVRVLDLGTVRASKSFYKVLKLLKAEKPKVVFTTGGQVNLLLAVISFFVNDIKMIARPTNQDNSKFLTLKAKLLTIFTTEMYSRFDKIICQSQEIKAYVQKKHLIADSKLAVIPNPISKPNVFKKSFNRDKICLIVVARLTVQKGITRLIDIMSRLPNSFYLTIVGEGTQRSEIEKQIKNLKLTSRVRMAGMIANVSEYIASHDIFVLPSFIEGFPNVVIESLSVGIPVISFEVGGVSEIITNDFNGFIIPQGDVEQFKEKILVAASKQWDHRKICSDVYNRFNIERVTKMYEQIID